MSKTNKYDADVIRLHNEGWIQPRIAKELGINQPYVSRIILRVGMRSVPSLGKHDEQVAELYLSGLTVRRVASTLKISPSTVMDSLQRKGITPRRPCPASILSESETALVLEQSKKGVSASDLAKQFNCTRQTIYNIRHRSKAKQ